MMRYSSGLHSAYTRLINGGCRRCHQLNASGHHAL